MRVFVGCGVVFVAVALAGCVAFSTKRPTPGSVETLQIGSCAPLPCAKVTFATLPELPEGVAPEAKEVITARVDQALYAPLEEGEGEISRARFIKEVTEQYEEYLTLKDPGTVVDWQVTRSAFIVYSNAHLVSVVVKTDGFLGGAHGFHDESLFVFDGASGRALSWDEVIEPTSRDIFERAAEAEFRRARSIPAGQTLPEAGFTFEGDVFTLPQNFAISDRGIVCHYNPYEIAPYVMGATDFTVPIEVVMPALRSDIARALPQSHDAGLL